jgi:hypothetical protein
VIEIPEPPDIQACASCMCPLSWLFSARRSEWVAFVPNTADNRTLHLHGCRDRHAPPSWRDYPSPWESADPGAAERVHRGAAMVRAVLAGAGAADEGIAE